MKHYGIWTGEVWMTSYDTGIIFWTTSKAVAGAQLQKEKVFDKSCAWEVREFIEE